ncbi:putative membrane protein [Candidatus Ichthyocystis hellenicum]|uniref:Putative membrane protein n=1 Tax=Candidatus Ichthyocystis hellenicum TaxID=1561003 RepID=A0A0S4M385_9BURK|nr:putative membrane protein [Candidatus Ichthyocystis hellenicum]
MGNVFIILICCLCFMILGTSEYSDTVAIINDDNKISISHLLLLCFIE